MAEIAHTTAGASGKADLTALTEELQKQGRRALPLLSAMEETLIDIFSDKSFAQNVAERERGLDAGERLLVFCELAKEAVQKAVDTSEAIEEHACICRHSQGGGNLASIDPAGAQR